MAKKIICTLLVIVFAFCSVTVAFAAEADARLYNVYSNGMLFTQNKDAIFAGEGTPGSVIRVHLLNDNGWPIRTASSKVSEDGTFEVSFVAPAGSYNEYTIVLTQDNDEFAKLTNVVFGELWIASGQSNMMYPLIQSIKGNEMFQAGQMPGKWLRVCYEPAYPKYNGTDSIPVEPQNDIADVMWIDGENPYIYSMGAVGFFFAEKLMNELDMPVGILNSSLGGSSIRSWLSREAIEADSTLKKEFIDGGLYIDKSEWDANNTDIYTAMTANYNLRTHAYRNFRPSGLIWYQGETDLIFRTGTDVYAHSFDALQQMYTDMFDYGDEFFPIIYTQIAPYDYGDDLLPEWNYSYTQMQSVLPESRTMITLLDLPLTYVPEVGVIHPATKQPVGQRMAQAALGMVYGKSETYTAASPEKTEIKDSDIYVTFKNVGEGLTADGKLLRGFAICGADGIYVQAQAEIVSEDTVRIWSDSIPQPVSASYAYCMLNTYSNLYSTVNGEKFMPVSTFVTKVIPGAVYWSDKTWADCEFDKVWHLLPDPHSAEFDTWKADGAQVALTEGSAYSGANGLEIKSTEDSFTVKPAQLYKIDKAKPFTDIDTDWSSYGKLSFMARNNGTADISLDEMRIYVDAYRWYSPAAQGVKDSSLILPADGEWHKITLDLDSLYLFGNECGFTYANEKLTYVHEFRFEFSGANADLSIDSFEFAPSAEKLGTRFEADIADADNVFEVISAMFTTVIAFFANIFS